MLNLTGQYSKKPKTDRAVELGGRPLAFKLQVIDMTIRHFLIPSNNSTSLSSQPAPRFSPSLIGKRLRLMGLRIDHSLL